MHGNSSDRMVSFTDANSYTEDTGSVTIKLRSLSQSQRGKRKHLSIKTHKISIDSRKSANLGNQSAKAYILNVIAIQNTNWTTNHFRNRGQFIYSLFECHISNTYKYTNIQQNKTYLIPSPFGLMRHYRFQYDFI